MQFGLEKVLTSVYRKIKVNIEYLVNAQRITCYFITLDFHNKDTDDLSSEVDLVVALIVTFIAFHIKLSSFLQERLIK